MCCGFTSSFNTFQVFLSPFLPGNKNTTQQLLLLVLGLVLGAGQVDFLFCWGVGFTAHGRSQPVVVLTRVSDCGFLLCRCVLTELSLLQDY